MGQVHRIDFDSVRVLHAGFLFEVALKVRGHRRIDDGLLLAGNLRLDSR